MNERALQRAGPDRPARAQRAARPVARWVARVRRWARLRALACGAARPLVSRATPPGSPEQFLAPADLARVFGPLLAGLAQERLYAVLLDGAHRVLAVHLIYQGQIDAIDVALRDCFREAVRLGASGIALVHNHPGGGVRPSEADLALTAEAMRAGDLLGIQLLDHLIIGRAGRGYSSIADWEHALGRIDGLTVA